MYVCKKKEKKLADEAHRQSSIAARHRGRWRIRLRDCCQTCRCTDVHFGAAVPGESFYHRRLCPINIETNDTKITRPTGSPVIVKHNNIIPLEHK